MQVVIVGAGVVGLSIAHELLAAGCAVTVLDAGDIPNPASASHDRSRMMRLQYGPQGGYARLASQALASWATLERATGTRLYRPTGCCVWSGTADTWVGATPAALREAGIAYRDVSPALDAARFLNRPLLGDGIQIQAGGVILADRVVAALAASAAGKGAMLHPGIPVLSVDTERGIVRTADGGTVEGDMVIVAAGAWTAKLLPAFTGRLTPVRSIAIYVTPPPELAADWATAPCTMIETRESMLYALPPVPEAPLKLAGTANLRKADPDRPEPVSPEEARAVLEAFRPYLLDIDRYRIIGTAMGHYADPPDKTFIIDRRNRAVIISGCGGRMFKFAPLLAADIVDVLTGNAAATHLDRWTRPGTVSGEA